MVVGSHEKVSLKRVDRLVTQLFAGPEVEVAGLAKLLRTGQPAYQQDREDIAMRLDVSSEESDPHSYLFELEDRDSASTT